MLTLANIKKTTTVLSLACALQSLSGMAIANELDQQISKMSLNETHIKAGQSLFESVCAACHKKDLSGAMGFNLKDGEWVHGDKPSQIYNNILNGFSTAGMPAFKGAFSDEQVKQIAAYVISKREGWDNLSYKVYSLKDNKLKDFAHLDNLTSVKSGKALKNIADFSIPETEEFAMVFEGDFYTPKDQDLVLYSATPHMLMEVIVDGKKVKGNGGWHRNWPLKRGKQHLIIKTMTPPKPFPKWTRTNLNLMVTNPEQTIKLFAVSSKAKQELAGTTFEIKATSNAQVQRKVVVDLPTYSVAVGLPEKINYGFNTRSCAISGAWQDEMLNIGPNIKGRGQDGSIALGAWIFNYPEQIQPVAQNCEFIKYNRQGKPTFEFEVDQVRLSMQGMPINNKKLSFNYKVLANPNKVQQLTFNLPNTKTATVTTDVGNISNHQLNVNLAKHSQFNIQVMAKGE